MEQGGEGRRATAQGPAGRGKPLITTVIACVTLAACASGSGGLHSSSLHLGRGTEREVLDVVPHTLNRFGYGVARYRATPNALVFETSWTERQPLEDEALAGLEAVRTRLTVEARRAGRLYSVWLRVENTGLGAGGDASWQRIAATPMFEKHVARVSRAIKDEIDTGLRVY